MTHPGPLIHIAHASKGYGAARPLRIHSMTVAATDRLVVSGFEAPAAEMFMHLVSGAAVPDEGQVVVAGADTRGIVTDTEWLESLDQFGLVSNRAVLLDGLSVAANLALPLTVAVEPMAPAIRARVDVLAAAVGLDPGRLDNLMGTLDPLDRLRVHLARALANGPALLLLEDPTRGLGDRAHRERFGQSLRQACDIRGGGWLALSDDDDFARASGGARWRLDADAGTVRPIRRWWPFGG